MIGTVSGAQKAYHEEPQGLQVDSLDDWMDAAREIFGSENGTSLAFGFIDSTHNLQPDYGWSSLYTPINSIKPYKHIPAIEAIKHNTSRQSRVQAYELNLINEDDICAWFYDLVFRQNNGYTRLTDKEGKGYVVEQYGRWSKRRPWGYQVRKRLKGSLETIDNPLLLSLTVHQPKVQAVMPDNTNMDAVVYSILNIGGWVSYFLKRLRDYQANQGIDWRYIGWVLEFQRNGFPHIHVLLSGDWIGKISEVARLWPWCEPQGVDYMNRSKLRRRFGGRNADPVRVANYLTAYVAQGVAAVVNPGDKLGKGDRAKVWTGETSIHKGFAYLAYFGGRIFNLSHKKGESENEERAENQDFEAGQ